MTKGLSGADREKLARMVKEQLKIVWDKDPDWREKIARIARELEVYIKQD